jgi:hypothetical protein
MLHEIYRDAPSAREGFFSCGSQKRRFAFLFDTTHPDLSGFYGNVIVTRILETGVLQTLDRPMRISLGDLPYAEGPISQALPVYERVFTPASVDLLLHERLDEHLQHHPEIFTFIFGNMMPDAATELHWKLTSAPYYLGALDLDFSELGHLWGFRSSIPEMFRLDGRVWTTFYSMGGDPGEVDPARATMYAEALEERGFLLRAEDKGARRTIFDDYDTPDHFKRVARVEAIFKRLPGIGVPELSSLTHALEELHPKLFDTFAAAAKVIDQAETEEDLAHAALSGRRVLEQIADHLYPPREEMVDERKVGPAEVRNRLWAYIQATASEVHTDPAPIVARLGKETDRIYKRFNAGLHHRVTAEKLYEDFGSLILWFLSVVALSPPHARRPYLAYQANLRVS